jgi:hypothetical protein
MIVASSQRHGKGGTLHFARRFALNCDKVKRLDPLCEIVNELTRKTAKTPAPAD